MATAVGFFNNKGGVGKTTLSCNLAAILSRTHGLNILYVDCDPQCNATQLLLDDSHWSEIFSNRRESTNKTLLKSLRHIRAGDSAVDSAIPTVRSDRFKIDVLPGHPSLSVIEDRLSASWVDFKAGDLGAARRSLWMASLVQSVSYDLVFFDMGPSLGALNRTVLLGCDRFVTPMAADLFSLYALDNIHEWVNGWIKDYSRGMDELVRGFPDELDEFRLPQEPALVNGFAGYTVQQYVSRSSGSEVRHVRAYEQYKARIPKRVKPLMSWASRPSMDPNLGLVPNMFSMVPLAQAAHAPIIDLKSSDGLRGAQVSQNQKYASQLRGIADRFARNLGVVSDGES